MAEVETDKGRTDAGRRWVLTVTFDNKEHAELIIEYLDWVRRKQPEAGAPTEWTLREERE
jgi:hypothetical protein